MNRADGIGEIEGKAARARGERLGEGASFKFVSRSIQVGRAVLCTPFTRHATNGEHPFDSAQGKL